MLIGTLRNRSIRRGTRSPAPHAATALTVESAGGFSHAVRGYSRKTSSVAQGVPGNRFNVAVYEARMGRRADVELVMDAVRESVTVTRQALSGLADAFGWDTDFLADAKIALSEAASNVAVHAYPEGPPGPLRVRFWVDPGQLLMVIGDDGVGITPSVNKQAGLGLGLPLMAALADEVQMRSTSSGATEVEMRFAIPAKAVS